MTVLFLQLLVGVSFCELDFLLKRWKTESISVQHASLEARIPSTSLVTFYTHCFTCPCQIIHLHSDMHTYEYSTRMDTAHEHTHTLVQHLSRQAGRQQARSDKYEACNVTAETRLMGSIKNDTAGHRENTARG